MLNNINMQLYYQNNKTLLQECYKKGKHKGGEHQRFGEPVPGPTKKKAKRK